MKGGASTFALRSGMGIDSRLCTDVADGYLSLLYAMDDYAL